MIERTCTTVTGMKKPAAVQLTTGLVLVIVAMFALLASGYFGLTVQRAYQDDPDPALWFGVVGWVCLASGLPPLTVGVYRLVRRGD